MQQDFPYSNKRGQRLEDRRARPAERPQSITAARAGFARRRVLGEPPVLYPAPPNAPTTSSPDSRIQPGVLTQPSGRGSAMAALTRHVGPSIQWQPAPV